MKVDRRIAAGCIFILVLLAAAGCRFWQRSISPYDIQGHKSASDLKVEATNLMAKAAEPYSIHQVEAEKLQENMDKAYTYSSSIPNNQDIAEQWALMKDPKGSLMGGFLNRWKAKSTLSPAFIQENQRVIQDGFDQLIQLEASKPK